ncbi:surface-adhesin E family protein [Pseudoduganella sp. UC29_106]|uniref:surface-adhesin E family protein n=1 Tax=Pseudoduganella sp. UC29_106 TaxID=3374553 RepID=UPI0037581DDD
MRRLLLPLLLAPALAAAGSWSKIGGDDDAVLLLDRASVHASGAGYKAATMQSYRRPQSTPDGKPYLSVRSQHLYNCLENTATLLSQDYFSGVLGRGEPVGTYKYESYDPEQIGPGAALESALKVVCKAKRRASGKGG